jgi:hypothetical protein
MHRFIGRLVKLGILASIILSMVASVKATMAANSQAPSDNT